MAQHLTQEVTFDRYIAVAPEGHVYGYFFEHFGAEVRAVFVDYPPRQFQEVDDLSVIRGQDALILEDDVISGTTLTLVVKGLEKYSPRSLSLYLGRPKKAQFLHRGSIRNQKNLPGRRSLVQRK